MDLRFRRLFLLRFGLVWWTFYFVYVSGFLAFEILRPNEELEARRRLDLEQQSRLALDLAGRHHESDLMESLRHSLRQGRVDFFAWKKDGKLLASEGQVPSLGEIPDGQVVRVGTRLLTRIESEGAQLEFGVDIGPAARAEILWRHSRLPWVKDYALLGFTLGLLLYVLFRDLAKNSGGRANFQRIEQQHGRLAPKSLRLKLAPEAEAGAPGLYGAAAFPLPNEPKAHAEALRRRHAECARLLRRYGGEILSVEREVFLISFPADSAAALAAARDLAREGAALSLAAGESETLTFGGQATPVGAVWAAILAGLDRKAGAGRVRLAPRGPALTLPLFREQGGFQAVAMDVEGALAQARAGDADFLRYFRHDQDLVAVLKSFAGGGWETKPLLKAVAALRSFQCPEGESAAMAEAYEDFLAAELACPDRYRLGVALALSTHLLPISAITPALELRFQAALALADPRMKANALEVFIHFFPERPLPELKSYLKDPDNRLSGIALIKAALEHFDEKVLRLLETRVKSGTVAQAASALYAVGEIAVHYRRLDPHYLAAKEGFRDLCLGLPELARHPNAMVRRQAIQAARKVAIQKVDEALRFLFEECEEEEVLELFANHYGWRKKEREAA